jgi:hypothetical protein
MLNSAGFKPSQVIDEFERKVYSSRLPSLSCLIILSILPLLSVGGTPHTTLAQTQTVFLVSYFASHNEAMPQMSEASATYISITNASDVQCVSTVEWRDKTGSLVCTTQTDTTVDPRLIAKGTVTHCSRDFKPVSGTPKCDKACSLGEGETLPIEGNATVIGDPNCTDRIAVDARVYFTAVTSDMMNEVILSAHSPKIFKLNTAGTVE